MTEMHVKIRPEDHGTAFGLGNNLSISNRPLKSLNFAHIDVCYFYSDNIQPGCFVNAFLLSTPRLEMCMFYICFWSITCELSSGSLPLLSSPCVSDSFLPTVKLNEASGWNLSSGLRLMLHVLVVGLKHTRGSSESTVKENNKIFEKIISCFCYVVSFLVCFKD